jgi:cell wall-associated protease
MKLFNNIILRILILYFFLLSCKTHYFDSSIEFNKNSIKNNSTSRDSFWYYKDILIDSIPGISLFKANRELVSKQKGKTVVVALIDGDVDISHESLKKYIWKNPLEIENNALDDDQNGYQDDVHGWNFWGHQDQKGSTIRSQFEYVRIFKKFNPLFQNQSLEQVSQDSLALYQLYVKAQKKYEEVYRAQHKEQPEFIKKLEVSFYKHRDTLTALFPHTPLTIENLKNLKTDQPKVQKKIDNYLYYLGKNFEKTIVEMKEKNQNYLDFYINIDYDDRAQVGDKVDDIQDRNYGSNTVFFDTLTTSHGTEVGSQMSFIFDVVRNEHLKIMPLVVAVYGNEHDKDIALAIRYAVDNGAHIINTTISKEFSSHNPWVIDAIKYAEQHDVLIIKSAGNFGYDVSSNDYFPNDKDVDGNEYVANFINVGASTAEMDSSLLASFSCYSKTDVDLFAPGNNIYCALPFNQYEVLSGTSYSAPIVTGIAALIKSYYPHLTASQIKEILMASGTVIDREVEITDANGQPKLVPFTSLSKSGKIVNAYNALRLAQHYKKWKKGKWTLEKIIQN